MFRQLARWYQTQGVIDGPREVLRLHPMELSRFLEEVWQERANPSLPNRVLLGAQPVPPALGAQERTSGLGATLTSVPDDIYGTGSVDGSSQPAVWDHLIYAYMVENTRVYEIFARVLREFLTGEHLGLATADTQRWLRATEELFYRDAPPHQVFSVVSRIRPDLGATRRNAYYRMFGMDLNHGVDDGRADAYVKPTAANRDFVPVFEEFLREVWRAVENVSNSSGPKVTDDAAISTLAARLQEMLKVRRGGGTLEREEFLFVSMMSWFHLTLELDAPVVQDLEAAGSTPDERLRKIGDRVGLPAHARSLSYFRLAEAMSRILILVEDGRFNTTAGAQTLYALPSAGTNLIREDMMMIVNHWSMATGRDMKAGKVTVSPRSEPAASSSGNGRHPVAAGSR